MLLRHHPQPHSVGLAALPHPAHPHLPLGHAVRAPTDQALLDDSHNLHRGEPVVTRLSANKRRRCVYTSSCLFQLTVVVKYFFQFGFFPWTTSAYRGINSERPFALPNIVGVEKKDGYVLFDLIQLLALFFHRSILKVNKW